VLQLKSLYQVSPLPLTDGLVGPDGAVCFLTGGRRLESTAPGCHTGTEAVTHAGSATDGGTPAQNKIGRNTMMNSSLEL